MMVLTASGARLFIFPLRTVVVSITKPRVEDTGPGTSAVKLVWSTDEWNVYTKGNLQNVKFTVNYITLQSLICLERNHTSSWTHSLHQWQF